MQSRHEPGSASGEPQAASQAARQRPETAGSGRLGRKLGSIARILPLRRAPLLALVAWAAFGFSLELYRSWWLVRADPWPEERPSTWRLGSGPAERLRGFLRRAEAHLPAGAQVAVVSEPGPESERRVRALWVAFYLPCQEVFTTPGLLTAGTPTADFYLTYGHHLGAEALADAGLEEVWRSAEGGLYRARAATDDPGGEP